MLCLSHACLKLQDKVTNSRSHAKCGDLLPMIKHNASVASTSTSPVAKFTASMHRAIWSLHVTAGEQDAAAESLLVGTVMVRDVVNRQLVAHFRAHTSPLLALQFDPSGTLLVTASLHGHNIHVFHICPWQGTGRDQGGGSGRPLASAVHLYRLARGVTPAVIRDISFSTDGSWLGVSSARGTTHIFRLVAGLPYGSAVLLSSGLS